MIDEPRLSRDPEVEQCLVRIDALSSALAAQLRSLPDGAWDGPTNCPPWRVRDLAAHVVISGHGFVRNIRNGLAGSVEPPGASAGHASLESGTPLDIAEALDAVTADFLRLYR